MTDDSDDDKFAKIEEAFGAAVEKAESDERIKEANELLKRADELTIQARALVKAVCEENEVPMLFGGRGEGYMPKSADNWFKEEDGEQIHEWLEDMFGEWSDPYQYGWWMPSAYC